MPEQSSTVSAERAKQGAEMPRASSNWAWVEAEVWTERMLSALENGVTGGKWYSLIDKVHAAATLALAWTKVQANHGAAGADGQSVERFAAKADDYLSELSAGVRAGNYRAQPVKRVEIPKGDGKMRPLGIPTVKDRIVQQAVRLVIEPIFESGFCDGSYGFRPGRGSKDVAGGRSAAQGRLHPCGGCRSAVGRTLAELPFDSQWCVLPSVCLLNEQGVPTRKRISRWERSVVWAMLRNPAYNRGS
jgi:Reverse transcriptase (RNA-dependent DNA polymerase)